jgi:tRNA G18 (ribose-2'-O)-methylase SpoU
VGGVTLVVVDDPADERLAPFRLRERGLEALARHRAPSVPGWFVAEGDLVVERALAAGCRPVAALCRADRPPGVVATLGSVAPDVPVYGAGDQLRRTVTGLGVPLDVVAIFERPSASTLPEVLAGARRLLVVEAVDNPTNLGALVRTAAGLGWGHLILDDSSADPLARRAVRTSMGTVFGVRWARCVDLPALVADLADDDTLTVALTPAADAVDLGTVTELPDRVVLAVGAERAGLTPEVQQASGLRARIPMTAGVDSLNVAAAAAIACFHLGIRPPPGG